MSQEMQNALAFYGPAPEGKYSGLEGKSLWLWETLQGDFHEDPSTAQIVTGTVFSMIPLVDQICDVRDLIANCRKINEEGGANVWGWAALGLTLLGTFPVLGSLGKGAVKVSMLHIKRFWSVRKLKQHEFNKALEAGSDVIPPDVLDRSIALFERYSADPKVKKTLELLKIYNPYLYLAGKVDKIKSSLSVKLLLEAMDHLMQFTRSLFDTIQRFVPRTVRESIDSTWDMLVSVRSMANEKMADAIEPLQRALDQLGNRLRVESDNAYRARAGDNTHVLGTYNARAAAELELIKKDQPKWVDKTDSFAHPPLGKFPPENLKYIKQGWPDISNKDFKTFDRSLRAAEIAPGEKLFRIVDQNSRDNSICWMREVEFNALKSKDQWRRDFAVWKSWNENGEYIVYTVPPGPSLKVWEGRAATQKFELDESYKLAGGRTQIVVNTQDLDYRHVSSRHRTKWGYSDNSGAGELDPSNPYLGLPELKNNWPTSK